MESIRFDQHITSRISPLQERAMKEAYLTLYAFAGAKMEDHFIFTSSGAEAVNHAIFAAYLDITRKTGKNHFLCSALDEAPAIMAMSRLKELGCVFQMILPNSNGAVSEKEVAEMLTPRTAMLSLSWANALTGVVQPLEQIAKLCRDRNILLHVEATHVLAKGDFDFQTSGADILTFHPPLKGMGGMFIRAGLEISPMILGGTEQAELRGGSFNVSELIEFAKWAKEERANTDHYCIEIARLRCLFEEILCAKNPALQVLFRERERVPHITNLLFPGITSDALCYSLSQKGVFASMGGNHLQQMVHLLKACKIPAPLCHTGLSFAFNHAMTEEEVQKGAQIILETVNKIGKYSEHIICEGL